MADISSWSPVDASNNASPPNGWPENMLASAVNDCARAMMGAIRRNYDQMITGTFAFTNIAASGTVTAGYIHSTGDVTADNAVTAPYIHSTGDLHADGAVTAPNITASGTVTAGLVYSTGDVAADNAVTAPYIHSTGDLHADGAVTAPSITASGTVTAAQLTSTGNIAASGTVTAGYIHSTGDLHADVAVTAPLISSSGNVLAAGNIYGIGYFCDGMAALDILNVSTPTGPHPAPSLLNDFAAPAIQVHSQNNLYASTVHIFVDNGGGYAPLQASAFVVSSDRRLKTDIEPSTPGLPEVLRLNPVSFRRLHAQQGRETGFVAQDVQEALPQAVTSLELNGETTLAVNDMPILAALVNAIKDLSKRLDSLEAR